MFRQIKIEDEYLFSARSTQLIEPHLKLSLMHTSGQRGGDFYRALNSTGGHWASARPHQEAYRHTEQRDLPKATAAFWAPCQSHKMLSNM